MIRQGADGRNIQERCPWKMVGTYALMVAVLLLFSGFCGAASGGEEDGNPPSLPIAQVTTEKGTLNLRERADARAGVLERIPNRILVTVIAQGDPYWKIQYGNTQGYALCEFLTMTDHTQAILRYRVLYRGNTGEDVRALKERLLELGDYRAGSNMNDEYNDICIERIKMFQRQNGLSINGIATAEVQEKLFSDAAAANAEKLPESVRLGSVPAPPAASGGSGDTDWEQWMLDHPGVCPCCKGEGCDCCDWTGKI